MVVKKVAILILIVALGVGYFFVSQNKKLNQLVQISQKYVSEQKKNLEDLKSAYQVKYTFLRELFFAKPGEKENIQILKDINASISYLEKLKVLEQSDLDNFEFQNNKLNELLSKEVISFNQNKKSLIKNSSQLRALERIDRFVDTARNKYSHWSYQFSKINKEMNQLFLKTKNNTQVLYYKIDHLIFSMNEKKSISRL